MSSPNDLIQKLPVADPRTILRALAQYAERFSLWSVDRFEVTLMLQSGHVVSGKAARMGRDLDGDCVLLYQGDEKDPALVYVRLSDVIAVRLNNPTIASRVFDEKKQEKVRSGNVPTRLQLKRDVERRNQEAKALDANTTVVDCVWDSLGETPDELYNADEILSLLPSLIKTIGSELLGQEALSKTASVTLRSTSGASLQTNRTASGIELTYDLRRVVPESEAIQAVLEKAL